MNIRFTLAVMMLLSFFTLHAQLTDHFKKIENKAAIHTLRNIDFIYMINLDERPEKFADASEQLKRYGIIPCRFSAINGWKLSVETINEVGVKYQRGMEVMLSASFSAADGDAPRLKKVFREGETCFAPGITRGAIGCALSHLSILKDAWDAGYETIWVLEDDIEVLGNPHQLSDLILDLDALVGKDHWDILFTDRDFRTGPGTYATCYGAPSRPDMDCRLSVRLQEKYTKRTQISPHFQKIGPRYGCHSMILRRSGIKTLLDFFTFRKIYWGIDDDNSLPEGIRRYALTYDLVTNRIGALSDNRAPNYKNRPSE